MNKKDHCHSEASLALFRRCTVLQCIYMLLQSSSIYLSNLAQKLSISFFTVGKFRYSCTSKFLFTMGYVIWF